MWCNGIIIFMRKDSYSKCIMFLMWWVFKFLIVLNLIIFRFWEILYIVDYIVISKYVIVLVVFDEKFCDVWREKNFILNLMRII